jgi:hypothetical protein
MCEVLHWLRIKQRIVLNTLMLIFKLTHGLVPDYLSNLVIRNNEIHHYNTRKNANIFVKRNSNQKVEGGSLFEKGIRIFNRIPLEIRKGSISSFRRNCCKLINEGKLVAFPGERIFYWDKI